MTEEEHKKIVEELKKRGLETDRSFIHESIVTFPEAGGGSDFEDVVKITREFNCDENVFKMGNTSRSNGLRFWDSVLATCSEVDNMDQNRKKRYSFMERFRYHYAIGKSAIKGGHADRYVDISDGLLGFRGAISYREAGVSNVYAEDERKKNRIKNILSK